MRGKQVAEIVEHINATWNLQLSTFEKAAMAKAWARYVGDLDYEDVMTAIDRDALSTPWVPKPAMLRAAVVHPDLPNVDEAWGQCSRILDYVNRGIATDKPLGVHEVVDRTILALKPTLNERSFKAEYEVQKANWLSEQFVLSRERQKGDTGE